MQLGVFAIMRKYSGGRCAPSKKIHSGQLNSLLRLTVQAILNFLNMPAIAILRINFTSSQLVGQLSAQ